MNQNLPTDEELETLKALALDATPGPWTASIVEGVPVTVRRIDKDEKGRRRIVFIAQLNSSGARNVSDARFIAAVKEPVVAIIDELLLRRRETAKATPYQQNVEIAVLCGWKTASQCGYGIGFSSGWEPWVDPAGKRRFHYEIPNYTSDLNACAEMRKALEPHERDAFTKLLMGQGSWWDCIDAPADRQCEAFLRVKGMWK